MLLKLGISGSIASGKSARVNHLVTSLAPQCFARVRLLSADQVGHRTYLPGTEAYEQLINRFGDRVLDKDSLVQPVSAPANVSVHSLGAISSTSTSASPSPSPSAPSSSSADSTGKKKLLPAINRKVLGSIVFSDPAALRDLNAIVWPALKQYIADDVAAFEAKVRLKREANIIAGRVSSGETTNTNYADNANIIICEAALMVESGIDHLFDEVWLLGCDKDEAIRRVMRRDGLDERAARSRVESQQPFAARQQALEGRGFVTSSPADNAAYFADPLKGIGSTFTDAHRILRTFDTTRHAKVEDGMPELEDGFRAMVRKWVGKKVDLNV